MVGPDPEGAFARLSARVGEELERQLETVLPAGLYLVPTPIGNLGDTTLRALAILARVDGILCEDTRHSGKLLSHFGIRQLLTSLHDHNEAREVARVVQRLQHGDRLALISDAGMPLVSDPGFKLVDACWRSGIPVTTLPGPSAPVTALAASGIATDRFLFAGFLPPKSKARKDALRELADVPATLVLFESPQRLASCLVDCVDTLGDRPVAIAREISKLHETIWRGSLSDAIDAFSDGTKGELVICIGQGETRETTDAELEQWILQQDSDASAKDIARRAADLLNVPRKRAYAMVVALRAG